MALIQRAHPLGTHHANQDRVGQQATDKAQQNQGRQHRPSQQLGPAGQQRGERRHGDRVGLGVGQAKQNTVPERMARRALRGIAIAALGADRTPAEPE